MIHVKPSVIVTTTPEVYFFDLESGVKRPFLKNVPPPDNYFSDIYLRKSNVKGIEWYPTGRHHYGICGAEGNLYFSTDEFPSKVLMADSSGSVSKILECPVHRTPPNRIHQMIMHQDKILAVSPTSDSIFRLTVDSNSWEIMPMSGSGFSKIPKWDSIHPNSINCVSGEIMIVCLRSGPCGRVSSVFTLRDDRLDLIREFDAGFHAHSIFPIDKETFVFDSIGCHIVSITGSRTINIDCPSGYYLKGVGVTNNFIVAGGLSVSERDDRCSSKGIIILMNMCGDVIDLFYLDHGVNDLRIVNQPDYGNCGNMIEVSC